MPSDVQALWLRSRSFGTAWIVGFFAAGSIAAVSVPAVSFIARRDFRSNRVAFK